MSHAEIEAKIAEVDRLLNDHEVRMEPHRVWSLLAEISRSQATEAPRRPAPAPHPGNPALATL